MKLAGTLNVFPFLPTATFLASSPSLMTGGPNALLPAQAITCLSLINILRMQPLGATRAIDRSTLKEKCATTRKRSRRIRDLGRLSLAPVQY